MTKTFKRCPACRTSWPDREAFFADPDLCLIGYQVHFKYLGKGFLLFNHERCGTTLALEARVFEDLYPGPFWADRATGGPECPGYCLDRESLEECPALCECRWVREVIRTLASRIRTRLQSSERRAALR